MDGVDEEKRVDFVDGRLRIIVYCEAFGKSSPPAPCQTGWIRPFLTVQKYGTSSMESQFHMCYLLAIALVHRGKE